VLPPPPPPRIPCGCDAKLRKRLFLHTTLCQTLLYLSAKMKYKLKDLFEKTNGNTNYQWMFYSMIPPQNVIAPPAK
jgi:hypothetical protein